MDTKKPAGLQVCDVGISWQLTTCSNDVVPVVMGARPEDYRRLAPPGSFIHVDDFAGPKDLAAYVLRVDGEDNLYGGYFRWKGTGDWIVTKFWCRPCALVHAAHVGGRSISIRRLDDWWRRRPRVCATRRAWGTDDHSWNT